MDLLKEYYWLTKPGIIRGNALTAATGFLLASKGHINYKLLLTSLTGFSLVIASACVFNNYLDRGIDKKMIRTKKRALVRGTIAARSALLYATVLGLLGFLVLFAYTNRLTVTLGLGGVFLYVVVYGIWKRRSWFGTIIGSLSGALPPVAGYVAVSNHLDGAAVILFFILVVWQMPHFYAISIYRIEDYAAAGLPVLPVKKGLLATKLQILIYIAGFMVVTSLLYIFGYSGIFYELVAISLGLAWFGLGVQGFRTPDETIWARKVFLFSLVVISLLCITISADSLLRST